MSALRGRLQRAGGLARSLWIYRRPGRLSGLKTLYRPLVPAGGLVFDVGAHLGIAPGPYANSVPGSLRSNRSRS